MLILLLSACSPQNDQNNNTRPQNTTNKATQTPQDNGLKYDTRLNLIISPTPVSPEENAEINRVFLNFQEAILNYKAQDAMEMLSPQTLAYYDSILAVARMALQNPTKASELAHNLSPAIRLNTALALAFIPEDRLLAMSGNELLQLAFSQGWIGYNSFKNAYIEQPNHYTSDGQDIIIASFINPDQNRRTEISQIGFIFDQHSKKWKIDLIPMFTSIDKAITVFVRENHLNLNELIERTVRDSASTTPPSQWKTYTYPKAGFSLIFPMRPQIYDMKNGQTLYFAKSHKYGDFSVTASKIQIDGSFDEISSKILFNAIRGFLISSHAVPGQTLEASLPNAALRRLPFTIGETHKGILLAVLTQKGHLLLVSAISETATFDEKIAGTFFDNLAF